MGFENENSNLKKDLDGANNKIEELNKTIRENQRLISADPISESASVKEEESLNSNSKSEKSESNSKKPKKSAEAKKLVQCLSKIKKLNAEIEKNKETIATLNTKIENSDQKI